MALRVVHVVTTAAFAGVERYVCDVANETAARGWDVAVVGGHGIRTPAALSNCVQWKPGANPLEAVRSLRKLGQFDVSHAHMTVAEAIAVATRRIHRAPVVATRHFAARRGASPLGRVAAPWIARGVSREIANGAYVAEHVENRPTAVLPAGVPETDCVWHLSNRVILVLQRLEPEKDTGTALRAWKASGLADDGWTMRVVGEGVQRGQLEYQAERDQVRGVDFAGWVPDVRAEFGRAGLLLATSVAEPFGLSVLEAMAAGVPVIATASGGHLETVGASQSALLFPPGDALAAAEALRMARDASVRERMSDDGRSVVAERFTVKHHVDGLIREYHAALDGAVGRQANPSSQVLV